MVRTHRMLPAGVRTRVWLLTAVLLTLGVAWMHTLASVPLPSVGHTGTTMTAKTMPQYTPAEHHDPCPGAPHRGGHAAAMCQSALPTAIGAPAPTFIVSLVTLPVATVQPLSDTVAAEAARGSGCGPPPRSMLSIWLT